MLSRFLYISHVLGIITIIAILSVTFYFQIAHHDLPCPLCLLQRMGFLVIAFGLLMNLRFGYFPSHYAVSLLGALYTLIASGLQVLLHIVPGDSGYGGTFLMLHFYTLAFIAALSFSIIFSVSLLFDNQFKFSVIKNKISLLPGILISAVMLFIMANAVSTFLECKLTLCPSNPTQYEFFS